MVILVVLTERKFRFTLLISQLMAKAFPVRGAKCMFHASSRICIRLRLNEENDTKIRSLRPSEKPFNVCNQHRLYPLVNPGSSRFWYLKYRISARKAMMR